MRWRTQQDLPSLETPAFVAVVAIQGDDGLYYLAGELYEWDGLMFHGEMTGDVPTGVWRWLPESDLLATLPDQAVING